jgi:Acyltransferase family.
MAEEKKDNSKTISMVFFISFLRALAACFITNAHYTGIYPTDLIANGGAIGDVLFFAVSGYCLYNVKYDLSVKGFVGWYGKRIWRVYPPVLIMTALFMILGAYSLTEHGFLWWYVYPTYYHFVASIIVLYIPFFFIMKITILRERIPLLMLVIGIVWMVIYFTIYDRSYYHIDTVREPMIRFLFMESMLLGAWFREKDAELRNKHKNVWLIFAVVAFVVYFASKVLFSKRTNLAPFQFLNQIAIFVLLFFLFRTFCGLDRKLDKMPEWLKKVVIFLSNMTLEIYVVQYVIINLVRDFRLFFPLNWFVLTASILIIAFVLHKVCSWMYGAVDKILLNRVEGKEG